mmetsp:Transcript_10032/g.25028  ORF Transcript_10032/g.25028 Transcript_10032/m.25028 type:complete len:240 (+) Transcript_10032:39-758(+)
MQTSTNNCHCFNVARSRLFGRGTSANAAAAADSAPKTAPRDNPGRGCASTSLCVPAGPHCCTAPQSPPAHAAWPCARWTRCPARQLHPRPPHCTCEPPLCAPGDTCAAVQWHQLPARPPQGTLHRQRMCHHCQGEWPTAAAPAASDAGTAKSKRGSGGPRMIRPGGAPAGTASCAPRATASCCASRHYPGKTQRLTDDGPLAGTAACTSAAQTTPRDAAQAPHHGRRQAGANCHQQAAR